MKKSLLPIIILLLVGLTTAEAQQSYNAFRHSQQKAGFRGVGIGGGLYFPELDYYKDRTGYDFAVSPAAMVGLDFWVFKPLAIRAAVGYQQSKGTQEVSASFKEETTITFIPISVDALFFVSTATRFSKSPMPSYYFGVGTEITSLNITYSSTGNPEQSLAGGTTLFHGIVGIEYPIGNRLKIGLEGQYTFGNFQQSFALDSGTEFVEDVSASGPKAFVTVKYVLWDYVRSMNNFPRRR